MSDVKRPHLPVALDQSKRQFFPKKFQTGATFFPTLPNLKLQNPYVSLSISNAPSPFSLSHPGPRCQIQPLLCIAGLARSEFVSFENLENHLYSISSVIVKTRTTFLVTNSNTQRHKGVIFPFYLLLFNTFSHLLFHFLFIYLQTTAGRHIWVWKWDKFFIFFLFLCNYRWETLFLLLFFLFSFLIKV